MGVNNATLNGHRVTHGIVSIPAWGCWYAEVSIDGEAKLSGSVELRVGDLDLRGTVLSGGPDKGRAHYRVVAGAGGWGRTVKASDESNDLGVRLSTVLASVATAVGEELDLATVPATRLGPKFARPSGLARQVLDQIAPQNWYVGEDGVTRIGRRARATYSKPVARGKLDLAHGTVTVATESIASIVPGIVIEGIEATDVEHEISSEGLRSTIWGEVGSRRARRLDAWRKLSEASDPNRRFRGLYEYRVVAMDGRRLSIQPVRVAIGMPDLRRVPIMPGVGGCEVAPALGSRVIVAFLDESPSRPVVVGFEDADGEGFAPSSIDVRAGGMVGGEHVMTTEACALLIYNFMVLLMAAAGGGPLIAAVLQPLLGAAMTGALTAQAVPAPPGVVAQEATAAAQIPGFATGVAPATTSAFFAAAIAAVSGKTANVSGKFPGIGSPSVRVG